MTPNIVSAANTETSTIIVVEKSQFDDWLAGQTEQWRNWINSQGFVPEGGRYLLLPDETAAFGSVLFIRSKPLSIWSLAGLSMKLPKGNYSLDTELSAKQATDIAIGWSLGTYVFDRYKESKAEPAILVLPAGADAAMVQRTVKATFLVRDLINMPAADMGPTALEAAASQIAGEFEARQGNIVGNDLITYHYPMVHAVGRAAADPPRVIDITWGNPDAPKVTLVGKGVCFDTGGLDIKSSAGMLMMKKDMGGAATVLGLAHMIMDAALPVRLRVLIPAVENSISGNAYRPGDVLTSRNGKTVEIGNTDAEGRLVLADALTVADDEEPDLLIDMATLTGAARVAVGTEISATFTDDEDLFSALAKHAEIEEDPIWRLPLWDGYRHLIDSKIADINNAGPSPFGGAITAGLFLKEFVEKSRSWVHFDIMAYNSRSRPGRPMGGEAFALRTLYALISERYSAET